MNRKKYFSLITGIVFATVSLSSCVQKDDWDTPPIRCTNKFSAPTMTMANFKAQAPANGFILINTDQIFDGYVISSDENGNFYKTISFQDKSENPTAGLQIEIDKAGNYADFPVGAHIIINAKGLRLGTDRGVVKIGSVDPTYAIGRIPGTLFSKYICGVCNGSSLDIEVIKPLELADLKQAQKTDYLNILVKVPNVQFAASELGKSYVNYVAGSGVDTDRSIVDTNGNSTILRNAGFSTFGATSIPEGKGSLTFVINRYNSSWRMQIRNLNDVNFIGKRFFFEGFDGNLDDWSNISIQGAEIWNIQQFGNPKPCVVMNGLNKDNEDWLISKPISLQGFSSAFLSFDTDVKNNGNPLEVFVTKNYTGNPATTLWEPLSAVFDQDANLFNTWTYSGNINLNAYLNKDIIIGFKYTSAVSASAIWQLDNIRVVGN
ncbi:DUF5689 domain-containing protein [Chryseobacterium sp. ISL-6]|uniref:DUF5689 domain-containing protein n=1 Tax=Chryseobacterium sp. ISL-6 TaxID=2819143 RepID=UPI001BEB6BFB|nr:DUF5689 domain-containing protein [Chryseobacterium sp. ISL-6]MBT2621746.1 choice-of-anchor J domain-containing protein [Chryseobacterium sp. ISL-6]